MVFQGNFSPLFRGGLRKDFRESYKKHAPEFSSFLNVGKMDGPEISAALLTGLSRFLERNDGEPVSYEDPVMGPVVAGVDKEFALGFVITRRTVEDDKYGKANQSAKWLAHAAQMTKEYRGAGFLDDAFTGTYYKGYDGKALCATDHTFINGINGSTSWSNRLATQVGVSVTGVTAMFDLFGTLKDHNGDPIVSFPDTIIISNNAGDIQRTEQIFNSSLEPFTADNQENAIKARMKNRKTIVSHYKTDANSWFMVDSALNDAHFLMRREVDFDDTFDFDTDAAKYKGSMRFMIWFVDPRGWAGSNPS